MSQTTTNVGRAQFAHPDLGYDTNDGGVNLQAALGSLWTQVSNHLPTRYTGDVTLANTASTSVTHNFNLALVKLKVFIFVAGNQLTQAQVAAQFSITQTSVNVIAIQNISGSSKTFQALILCFIDQLSGADLSTVSIDALMDVDTSSVAPQLSQALVWDGTNWVPGASGDASLKLQSIATPTLLLKGGTIIDSDGSEYQTYDGSGALSTDFAKDLSVSLTTILGSSPANATYYTLAIDKTKRGAIVTQTNTGRKVYAVVEGTFALLTSAPNLLSKTQYIPLGFVHSATTGNAWSGSGSAFGTFAYRRHDSNDVVTINPTRYDETFMLKRPGVGGQRIAGHTLDLNSFPKSPFTSAASSKLSFYNLTSDGSDSYPGGAGRNLTNVITPFTANDIMGVTTAPAFNGVALRYLSSTDAFFNPGNKSFALGIWAASFDWGSGASPYIVSQTASGDNGFYIGKNGANGVDFAIASTPGSGFTWFFTYTIPGWWRAGSIWHHFAMFYDATLSTAYALVDGEVVYAAYCPTPRATSIQNLVLGLDSTLTSGLWNGILDEFWFQNSGGGGNDTFSIEDIKKTAAARLSHNLNVRAKDQRWYSSIRASGATEDALTIVVKEPDTLYYSGLKWLDNYWSTSIDTAATLEVGEASITLQDAGLSPFAVGVAKFDETYLTDPGTSAIPHDFRGLAVQFFISQEGATPGEFEPVNNVGLVSWNKDNVYLDLSSLTIDATHRVRVYSALTDMASALIEASPTQRGIVTTTDQGFGGIKNFVDGLIRSFNVHATAENTDMNMVIGDNPYQAFDNTINIDVNLPTTDIPAGYEVMLVNLTGNSSGLVPKASNGDEISLANGSNQNGTIAQGSVVLMAKIATPITAADWEVVSLEEEGQQTFTVTSSPGGSYSETATFNFYRNMEQVTWSFTSDAGSAGVVGQANLVAAAGSIAARLAPATAQVIAEWFETASAAQSGYIQFNADGSLVATLPGSVFVNTCSLSIDGTTHNTATYLLR